MKKEKESMDFYQLKTFYHVAKQKSFTRASIELSISQPAVSRQIESLEKKFGLTLFHRVGREIQLTDSGLVLFEMAEKILSLVGKTESVMEGMKNLESGSIVVGASTTIGNYLMAPIVINFMKKYPGVSIKLEIQPTDEILSKVKNNLLDIAIIPEVPVITSLINENLLQDEIVLIARKNHPLTNQKNVRLEDLINEKFVMRGQDSNTRKTIEKHLKQHEVNLQKYIELDSTEAIKQAVLTGEYISFVSRRTIQMETKFGEIQVIEGKDLSTIRNFHIVRHKETFPSPVVDAFIRFINHDSCVI
jgi:DNA-binding transcriptional LysR family regulator